MVTSSVSIVYKQLSYSKDNFLIIIVIIFFLFWGLGVEGLTGRLNGIHTYSDPLYLSITPRVDMFFAPVNTVYTPSFVAFF